MPDIFDRVTLDLFDEIELPIEEKVVFSKEMADLVREELKKEIAKIPMAKIIGEALKGEESKNVKSLDSLKDFLSEKIKTSTNSVKKELGEFKEKIENELETAKKNHTKLGDILFSQPWYQFGGFPQTFENVNVGTIINFGDPNTDGSWRIFASGDDFIIQHREGGAWAEKGAFSV